MTRKPSNTYATAGAFRKALEERLKQISKSEQKDINRLRRQVAFDRLLARLFRAGQAPWALKGGYALELRLKTARSTVDLDLTIATLSSAGPANQVIREMLQDASNSPLGDWLEYLVGSPTMDLDGPPDGGARYPVEARMDARTFARFHLDMGIGHVMIEPLEAIDCRQWLQFAGITGDPIRAISREQHFAEKLHAYTLPRSRPNTRVKDLVDMALLLQPPGLNAENTRNAIHVTFAARKTHEVPVPLPTPPADWQRQFSALAIECQLSPAMEEAWQSIQIFLLSA